MSYTAAPEDGPSWMNRLPRISSQSRSQARTMSDTEVDELKMPQLPPGTLPPVGLPGNFLRRVKNEDSSDKALKPQSAPGRRRKNKKWDDGIGPGGPISQSAIFPQRRSQTDPLAPSTAEATGRASSRPSHSMEISPMDAEQARKSIGEEKGKESADNSSPERSSPAQSASPVTDVHGRGDVEIYDEGNHLVIENRDGDVIAVEPSPSEGAEKNAEKLKPKAEAAGGPSGWSYESLKQRLVNWRDEEMEKRKEKGMKGRKSEPARAYQFGTTIIVENEDGEVVRTYDLPSQKSEGDIVSQSLKYMGMGGLVKSGEKSKAPATPTEGEAEAASRPTMPSWASGVIRRATIDAGKARKKSMVEEQEEEDDRHIRFTIGGVGRRMTKENFIQEMQKLDKSTRREIVDQSTASGRVKTLAKQDPPPKTPEKKEEGASSAGGKQPSPPKTQWQGGSVNYGQGSSSSGEASGSSSRSQSPGGGKAVALQSSSGGEPESAAEKRRRLAVLKGVDGNEDDAVETAAERRRREAALGVAAAGLEEDSEDDDTPRVPKRGIRFAEPQRPE